MYAHGSLLPLSTSRRGEVLNLRLNCRDLRMENTEAASVEESTAPMRKLKSHPVPMTKWTITPVTSAVTKTPADESSTAGSADFLAVAHLVQKPP